MFPQKETNSPYKFIYQNYKNFENTEDSEFRSTSKEKDIFISCSDVSLALRL